MGGFFDAPSWLMIFLLFFCDEGFCYDIFNPTPQSKMRKMSMDRPDTTESPFTVDAGHYQAEISILEYEYNRHQIDSNETYAVAKTTLKAGIYDDIDLQWVFSAYSEHINSFSKQRGFDDVQVRLKWNFFGNDESSDGLGVISYFQIPAGNDMSHGQWEGGWIFPYTTEFKYFSLNGQFELDLVYDEQYNRQAVELLHTNGLGFDFTETVNGFVEYIGIIDAHDSYKSSLKQGLAWSVNNDFVLDCGFRVGLNRQQDDFGYFVGMSFRH
ncbi:MAG: transporter [Bacteroidetes bacterium]|nr:transporter [Bacteroidota bacterium]